MRVFITGATGFIGTALIGELTAAGHTVLGLARSEGGARVLAALGVDVHRGALEDTNSLKSGAAHADAVIHLAFNHDFARYQQNCEDDRRAIEAMASVLVGTAKPLIVTSGTGMARAEGRPVTEADRPLPSSEMPRAATEEAADAAVAAGVNASVVRLPQVHDTRRQGLVSYAIQVARQSGVSAYVGDGANRWSAAHVSDVARLYRLALEQAEPGARWHAVAEPGVPVRAIAEVIGRQLGVPTKSITPAEAGAHFGWLGVFAGHDAVASSDETRRRLGWNPAGPTMLEDLERLDLEAV